MIKKISLILIFVSTLCLTAFPQQDIFWDKEEALSSGKIGKFFTFTNDKVLGLVYANTSGGFDLYFRYTRDTFRWSEPMQVVNNYFTNNPIGDDFSADFDSENNLYICYRENKSKFVIVKLAYPFTNDKPVKFAEINSDKVIFLPKIYIDAADNVHILYNHNEASSFVMNYRQFDTSGNTVLESVIGKDFKSAINPMMLENGENLYIAFQAKDNKIESGFYYNIILAISKNMGKTWSYKTVVTSRGENNQGPFLFLKNNTFHLTWEKEDKNLVSHIYYKSFEVDKDAPENEVLISGNISEAHKPYILLFSDILTLFWYDNRSGSFQNYYVQFAGNEVFQPQVINAKQGRTLENRPIIYNNNLMFFWNQSFRGETLYYLKNDQYVNAPAVFVRNILKENIINTDSVLLEWKSVDDGAGIKGYRVFLTQNKDEMIPDTSTLLYYKELSQKYQNLKDGEWYFKIKALDNAGNESKDAVFAFTIDTTPPKPPVFVDPKLDADGTLTTNSPRINWTDSNEPLKAFSYNYHVFNNDEWENIRSYQGKVSNNDFNYTADRGVTLNNLDNGILLIGLRGYDRAGNISAVVWKEYVLNNYIPSTFITYISAYELPDGKKLVDIHGRGFKADGDVSKIFIDKDGKAPYDYVISGSSFDVASDRLVKQTKEIEIDDGSYYIGVEHPVRGVAFYNEKFKFAGEWVFKYKGDNFFKFDRVLFLAAKYDLTKVMFISISIVWSIILLLLFIAIFNTVKEKRYISYLMQKLENVKEEVSTVEYKKRRQVMIKKGLGLTIKYTVLILALVITIVSATSITLSALALKNETINLANEMNERARLVMTNYETTMLDIYTYEKGFTEAVDATVNFATLPDIGFTMFRETNGNVFLRYGEKSKVFFKGVNFDELTDSEKENIVKEKVFTKEADTDIQAFKVSYNGDAKIYPDFDPAQLKDNYIFIKPVIVELKDGKKYSAEIVIGYSFERILELIKNERLNLIKIAIVVTLIAIFISIIGSVFLATTTIRPIKKMSRHVNVIATTDDYESLLGTEDEKIEVKSSDEIGVLASSINDMTGKLIEKAKADKQMMLGKEIQKKFIPLEPLETDFIDIHGYYEGAKGVSGDYFDYKKLDDDHYAFIICDVAGKAVPAALIMVQISTIFHSFCASFNTKKDKLETVNIVNTINDTVAERGFQGRFAAILVIIFNIKTGKALLTNAGYTQLLVYRERAKKAEWIQLDADSGAAGVFPSYMLPNPYVQEEMIINRGDIIYLFTDGIEESRNGKMIKTEDGDEKPEEFGNERIKAILDQAHGRTPKQMIEMLMGEERIFRGDLEQYDDLTILGIKRK